MNWELIQYEDGATRSKIEVGWHPRWGREERRRERRRRFETQRRSGILIYVMSKAAKDAWSTYSGDSLVRKCF